jgi:hypothetical protein
MRVVKNLVPDGNTAAPPLPAGDGYPQLPRRRPI